MPADGVAEQTVLPIAGHTSRQMLEHDSHIRREVKREAVAALERPKAVAQVQQAAPTVN